MNNAFGILLGLLLATPVTVIAAEEKALPWEDARRFAEALETIRSQYVEPVDDARLINEAIRGMAAGLDPYSVYLDPVEYQQARLNALGRYEGIGVEVSRVDNGYAIIAPFDGGPAQRAGLLPGDVLLSANGAALAGLDAAQLDSLLHGDAGTSVTLTVQRDDREPFDVTLTRELVKIPSVSGERIVGDIVYVRLALFSDRSADDLARLLDELAPDGDAAGLVLDLRNNAGGIVDGAVSIADAFLDHGTIVSTRGRATGQSHDYVARPGDVFAGLPMAVLVNNGTASAAEILAGALQDHERAVVLGVTTFGKGAVQSLIPLEGGGALKLTTAHYRTPSGRIIHDAGIVPDVEVPATTATIPDRPADDALVRRAAEVLKAAPASRGTRQ